MIRCVRVRFFSDVGRKGLPSEHRGNFQSHSPSPVVGFECAIVVGAIHRGQEPTTLECTPQTTSHVGPVSHVCGRFPLACRNVLEARRDVANFGNELVEE